ncbi:MAG: hypothetical protein N2Z73_03085, partial [Endomicrobia bacterium]|nr:hypothetical protein [Endomicrobiia bacterium]
YKTRNITIDGIINIPTEWYEDEVYYDSQNDSPWGLFNELHKLLITWDEGALYIGVVGIQKDGNNLIVYIDTSPISGIDDASKLKDPGNPQRLWWWRRGNLFPDSFKPEFQWHMYEMKLNVNEGHGLFKVNDDYTVFSLNDKVVQKSSGGGTAKLGSAEIRIPWCVLYGNPFFPIGREFNIIVCLTGGMDTKGNEDTSDDEFGSARDTIPDQKELFPVVWTQKVKIERFLTIKLDRLEGRQPYSRNLELHEFDGKSVIVKFDYFPWQRTNTELTYFVFCSTSFDEIRNSVYLRTQDCSVKFENLNPGNTYYFAIATSTTAGLSETVMLYVPKFMILSHKPEKFLFRGKDLEIVFLSVGETDEMLKFYWRYTNSGSEFKEILMQKNIDDIYVVKLSQVVDTIEFYVGTPSGYKYPREGVASVKILDRDTVKLEPNVAKSEVMYDGANYKLELQIKENTVGTIQELVVENSSIQDLLNTVGDINKIKIDSIESVYKLYCVGKTIKFLKPIEITVPAENASTVMFCDGQNSYVLPSVKRNNKISFKLYTTGFVVLSSEKLQDVKTSKLLKVLNNKFSHSGPYLQFVFANNNRKEVKIFDLNYNLVWESGVKYEEVITWDGKNNGFMSVQKGLYIYQIKFEDGEVITGLCVIK